MYQTVEAIVIKGFDYSETSRIFTLFSREEGRLSAIAKGVKKPKSALAATMQLGNRVEVVLSRGRSMDTVTQAQLLDGYAHVRANARLYMTVCYCFELVSAALPERAAQPELYDDLACLLTAAATQPVEALTRWFELRLLDQAGYRPDFEHCDRCGAALSTGYISPAREGVVCGDCGGGYALTPKELYALKFFQNSPAALLPRLKTDEQTMKQLARATRHLLDYSLERRLRSVRILDEL